MRLGSFYVVFSFITELSFFFGESSSLSNQNAEKNIAIYRKIA